MCSPVRAGKVNKAKQEVQNAQQKIDNMRSEEDIKADITQTKTLMAPMLKEQTAFEEKKLKLKEVIKGANLAVKRKRRQLDKLGEKASIAMQQVRGHPDCRKAVAFMQWLASSPPHSRRAADRRAHLRSRASLFPAPLCKEQSAPPYQRCEPRLIHSLARSPRRPRRGRRARSVARCTGPPCARSPSRTRPRRSSSRPP